jgi:hypothetical protein
MPRDLIRKMSPVKEICLHSPMRLPGSRACLTAQAELSTILTMYARRLRMLYGCLWHLTCSLSIIVTSRSIHPVPVVHMSYARTIDVPLLDLDASGMESNKPLALAFRNDDVTSLTREDLLVKVIDRTTKADKYILSAVSGHVKAGTSAHSYALFDSCRRSLTV